MNEHNNIDNLDNEKFTCMDCKGIFSITEGTFPQNDFDGTPIIETDFNNRIRSEFVCYDCCG